MSNWIYGKLYIDGFVQDCSNTIANALGLLQSCDKLSMCFVFFIVADISNTWIIEYMFGVISSSAWWKPCKIALILCPCEIWMRFYNKGIKNGCPCIVEIRGTQGCALVGDPARAVGECRDVAKAQP